MAPTVAAHRARRPGPARLPTDLAREAAGATLAVAAACWLVAHLARTPRRWVLFFDGDAVLPLLVRRSLAAGEAQDWAMSSVLHVPELTVYLALSASGLSPRAALVAAGIVNLAAIYAALRWVAGASFPDVPRQRRIAAAGMGYGVYLLVALTESSADRNALELASLQATTTYYAFSVVGLFVVTALLAGWARRAAAGTTGWPQLGLLAVVVALLGASNPLLIAWAVPLLAQSWRWRQLGSNLTRPYSSQPFRSAKFVPVAAFAAGTLGAFALRLGARPLIAADPGAKIRPGDAPESARYFAGLLAERLMVPAGWSAILLVGLALTGGAWLAANGKRFPGTGAAVLGGSSLVLAAGAIVLTIGMGTMAARYLQPVVAGAALAATGIAAAWPAFRPRHRPPCVHATHAVALLRGTLTRPALALLAVAGGLAVGALPALGVAAAEDPDVACVLRWADVKAGVGAGEFWAIRAIAAAAPPGAQIVQTDAALARYAWLINRESLAPDRADYVVTEQIPLSVSLPAGPVIGCGRYTIHDLRQDPVPLGPVHS